MVSNTKPWFSATAIAAGAALLLSVASPLRAELASPERNVRLAAIAEDARALQKDASQMESALREKNPDLAAVRMMLNDVEADIKKLHSDVFALEAASPAWASSSEPFAKMKNKILILDAFSQSKASLLEASDGKKNRKILAAQAKGIALRADLLGGYATAGAD